MKNKLQLHCTVVMLCALALTGCQLHTKSQIQNPNTDVIAFAITGKIGVNFYDPSSQKRRSGSAFYAWQQNGARFAINLTGALGVGKVYIEGTASKAKLVSQNTGELSANTPEELLQKATQWQAPISQLPFWIMGKPAKKTASKTANQYDQQGRLVHTQTQNWQATLSYRAGAPLPYKLKMKQKAAQKQSVIISIHGR